MASDRVHVVIDIEVSDIPRFKELVAAAVEISREEPGTLIYDWYLDETTGEARLNEAYESMDALSVHTAGRVFTELGPEFMKVCKFRGLEVFGDTKTMTGDILGPTRYWGPAISAVTDHR